MPDDSLQLRRSAFDLPSGPSSLAAVPVPEELLLVAQSYWPEPAGSAPMMTDLATAFAAAGAETTVLTARPNYPGNRVYDGYADGSQDSKTVDGVLIERLPTIPPAGGGLKARLIHEGVLHAGFAAALARGRVGRHDAVLSLCPSILSVALADRLTTPGGRHVAIVHDIQSGLAGALGMGGKAAVKAIRAMERRALNRADAIVVLSEPMRGVLEELGVTKPIAVIPPHVDADAVHPLPRPDQPPTALYSGAFARKQGLEQVLEMAGHLGGLMPQARVLLRGQGGLEEELKAQARAMGLSNVTFEPLAPKDRLNEAMAEGDVHLVPQRPEGAAFAMPGKAVTILAAGRPFVATCLPGSALAALESQVGAFLCTPPEQPLAMAQAVAALLSDPSRATAMGRRGRAWVESNATRAVALDRYARLLLGNTGMGEGP
ncbi:glycosyltransferase family 4 protein [Azospirillum picis]|uniref:Colanic acid biosynthesis glycosyl transferase WcaI n=1 Tax=Azospirillum picis TaxID=488438 RepID=A0ABU0MDQ4_9PROT|nr:glycosyltransferase family 4 protein [Azospirillum picis]MBP2297433.1 colanic acid biosynthesis glycosyl transferase WcaI [Azospirillum picis]MDQ0531544.1 colanic acid biosynthesis glycosyl transferase WcaI [Azospirillum picis]